MPWLWLSVSEVSGKRRIRRAGTDSSSTSKWSSSRSSSFCEPWRRRIGDGDGGGGEDSVVPSTWCSSPTAAATPVYARISPSSDRAIAT